MEKRTVWIYALVDPRDQLVKYVGQSCNLKNRYQTLKSPHSSSRVMYSWMLEMRGDKVKPVMIILEETNQDEAGKAELKWIMQFKEAGAPLLNQQMYEAPDYRNRRDYWAEYLARKSSQ